MTETDREQYAQWLPVEQENNPRLGRDIIFDYLKTAGVDRLYGVPGTNEIPLIDGTDVPENQIRYVPCLHENIALGAAMGYARHRRTDAGEVVPGVVGLHVTPGVGHALGNLFNASRSHIPLLVLCGQQHSNLLIQEPLLGSDLVQVAQQYTKWAYEVRGPNEIGMAMQRALKTALAPPMGPVFLSIPWEFLVQTGADPQRGRFTRIAREFHAQPSELDKAADLLARSRYPVIVAGDGVGEAEAWRELQDLATAIGAPVYNEQLSSYLNYPHHLAHARGELPSVQQQVRQVLGRKDPDTVRDTAFLCGFNAQAQLVIYDWDEGPLIPGHLTQVYLHNDPWQIGKNHYGAAAALGDIKDALPKLTAAVKTHPQYDRVHVDGLNEELAQEDQELAGDFQQRAKEVPGQGIAPAMLVDVLDRVLRDHSVHLVNEACSDTADFQQGLSFDSPTSYMSSEGGSLGYSMPASLGVADALAGSGAGEAEGKRPIVVNAVGDGSALFYLNAWWTAAKFQLPVLYLITNNKQYKTLRVGLDVLRKSYDWEPSGTAEYLELDENPQLSFVDLAAGFGVDGCLVDSADDLERALTNAVQVVDGGKPYVVEVLTDPDLPDTGEVDIGSNGQLGALRGDAGHRVIWNFGPA
ncbi:thiamine pyrophosphate-binding protein [Saccharopolyspora sp. WRP15-2]|uniref:Thiamine pyrophosphate-binding protein n=1 Tax=Saccharopolyspora oryzae TaxID=2997343 RepID=A0ABT4UQB2_9PSEU|nr:thiamine pyrophosphate-binding protein [Saccharopolyspora oryzae]MDA3623917.1 thiamine pyrophosphate-binding protein [Saccharopolyspora oryzae]